MLALVALLALSQADSGSPGNLLAGLTPKAEKASNAERMNDGKAADPGDGWQTILTSVMEKDGNVTWDFGAPRDFEGAWIQADNNDIYMLSVSDDSEHFTTVWESSTVDNAGMQTRTSTTAKGHGRYLRLTAKGGDGMFSVGELAVFANGAEAKTFAPTYVRTAPAPQPFDGNWIVIAVVMVGLVALVKRMKTPEAQEASQQDPPSPP